MSAVLDSPPASPPAPPRRAAAQLSAQAVLAAEDKRRKLIRLTPQGRALVEAAWQQTEHEFAQRLADVPGAKLAQIPGALEALTPGPVNTTARGAKRRIGAPI